MEGFIDKDLPSQREPNTCHQLPLNLDLAIREVAFSGVFLILEHSIPELSNIFNTLLSFSHRLDQTNKYSIMASRLSPAVRLVRAAAPLRQNLARPLLRQVTAARHTAIATARFQHNIPTPPPIEPKSESESSASPESSQGAAASPSETIPAGEEAEAPKAPRPEYHLSFTCRPCGERSNHVISKQGYHHGSVLVTCPGCKNRHVISDNLNIFGERKINVEDLVREQGGIVRKGTLGEDGDIEFWADETEGEPKKEGES